MMKPAIVPHVCWALCGDCDAVQHCKCHHLLGITSALSSLVVSTNVCKLAGKVLMFPGVKLFNMTVTVIAIGLPTNAPILLVFGRSVSSTTHTPDVAGVLDC